MSFLDLELFCQILSDRRKVQDSPEFSELLNNNSENHNTTQKKHFYGGEFKTDKLRLFFLLNSVLLLQIPKNYIQFLIRFNTYKMTPNAMRK